MINLAGVKDADRYIAEELYLAGIHASEKKIVSIAQGSNWATYENGERSEVPYSIMGDLDGWVFRRAWYYYMVSCPDGLGLAYDVAVKLHEKKYPIDHERYDILGKVIRVDGDCGCPHPNECKYSTLEEIEQEFVEARKKYPDMKWDAKEAFDRSWLRELDGIKYIRLYHIDTQIGLTEFVKAVKDK